MKLLLTLAFVILLITKAAAANEATIVAKENTRSCDIDEIEISLIKYSYCEQKSHIEKLEVISGINPTLYIKTQEYELSFSKLPISLALLDIPKKLNISLSDFFNNITNRSYTSGKFIRIRQAFEINKSTIIIKHQKSSFKAISIINKNAITNSIYIYKDNDEFIYLIKGNFGKEFSEEFTSKLKIRN